VIRLVILAPGLALRAGLRSLLRSDDRIEITGEAAGLASMEVFAAEIDVIVWAFPSPPGAGNATTLGNLRADLLKTFPDPEVFPALLLLGDRPPELDEILDLPVRAWGFLSLDASAEELAAAVHALGEGLWVGPAHLLKSWVERRLSLPERGGGRPSILPGAGSYRLGSSEIGVDLETPVNLTPRETEVLQLLAQGLANKQIALVLGISDHTVKFHVSSIYAKLGVVNRTEAVRAGARRGLIVL
jgi:DNA-binding NarL/FixJ family response regulator